MPPLRQRLPALEAPKLEDIEEMARATVDALPEPFKELARSVALQVADFATEAQLRSLDIEDMFELTGLYEGCPLTERSTLGQPEWPDIVWIFRRPLLDEWASRGDVPLGELVSHVVVHEFAHHFGWSDSDIAAIDKWWE